MANGAIWNAYPAQLARRARLYNLTGNEIFSYFEVSNISGFDHLVVSFRASKTDNTETKKSQVSEFAKVTFSFQYLISYEQ